MPLYESVVIARQDISTSQADALADDLSKILENNGAEIKKRENWGLRSLAYRIKKNRKGHYLLFNIDGPSEAISDYERRMRIMEQVLRYMTIRVEKHDEKDSVIIASRGKINSQDTTESSENNSQRSDKLRNTDTKKDSKMSTEGDS